MIGRLSVTRTHVTLIAALVAGTSAIPVRADGPVDSLTWAISAPAPLRAALVELARSRPAADSLVAGEAWSVAALGYQRAGDLDSARVCLEQAVAQRHDGADMDALIESLFARKRSDDLLRVRELLRQRLIGAHLTAGEWDVVNTQGRSMWLLYLDGRADSARTQFARQQRRLLDTRNPVCWTWRTRMATAALAAGQRQECIDLIKPQLVRSRLQDPASMTLLRDALGSAESERRYGPYLRSDLVKAENEHLAILGELGAVSSNTAATDGFPLAGVRFAAVGSGRSRAAIVLMDRDEGLTPYDSLASEMRRAGWTVLLMQPRGSGRAVAPECPGAEAWFGREELFEAQVAVDVHAALRGLARAASIDTAHVLLISSRGMAGVAVEAASLHRQITGLLLISPLPPATERGRTRARLAHRKVPVFFMTAPTDLGSPDVAARLYEAVDPKTSRLVDGESMGSGPMVFRFDEGAWPRFKAWLDERWPRPAPKPATPPKPRPKG